MCLKGRTVYSIQSHIDLFEICYFFFFFLWHLDHIIWLLLSCLIACLTPAAVYLQFSCFVNCASQQECICDCSSFTTLLAVNRSGQGQKYQLCFGFGKTRWYQPAGATAVTKQQGSDHTLLWALGGHAQACCSNSTAAPVVLIFGSSFEEFPFPKLQALHCWTELLAADNGNTSIASMAKFLYLYPTSLKSMWRRVNWRYFLSYGGRDHKASVLRLLKICSLNGITLTYGCYWDDHSLCSL